MGFIVDVKAGDIRKLFEIVELLHGLMMEYLVELSRQIDTDEVVADLRNGEILEALESVLPKKVLLYWMDLPQEEKILQMEELADVVIGIRVFNKCMQRGGEQFILPYTKYEVESDNLRKRVQDTIKLVDSRVANCILGIRAHVGEFGLGHMFIVRLRDELTYFMQAAVYLNSLDIFIVERLNEVINVREYSAHCVNRIVGTIGNRKNIPAELVYPELRRIGMYQRNILQEYNLLRAHSVAADPLFALSEKPEFVMAPMGSRRLEIKAKNFLFLPRGSSLECPSDSILEIGGCQRATLVDDGQVESLKSRLEYGGFCPVSLVVKNGMLMRGDTKIGLVQTGDKFYAFADEEAMGRFLKAPQAYLRSIHAFLLKMPQLIHILGLHNTQAFSYVSIPKILQLFKEPLPSDFGVQTCAHALPIHRWDEETLEKRVQALKKMRTDSTQTKESHFHRHNLCQVYPMKEKWTQTGVSRGTTMAHHVRVLHNLRGDLHENVKVVKATFEMEDTVDLYQLNRGMNADESEESRLRICEGRAGEEGPSSGDL
ncbi:hypothetical protein MPTK1_2g09470 [Marchantia polymorpha subsp. ruderalis]|nr:hypothetical protein MARPO_0158s0018 [Marchantia polymorpha]BBN01687.1 hypothetical protein Mp_2g09470 [Marchantia polymorpha subsp. ruderalis]|eukprot:PTQ28639.1 hypothetical protein MARPO_0158s0018 [Marchantia polymorpha]